MSYDWCNPYVKPVSHTHNSSLWQWNWTAVFCGGEHYLSRWLLTLLFQHFEKFTSKCCFVLGTPYQVLWGRHHSSVKLLLAVNPWLVLSISRQDVFGTLSRSNPVFWEHKSVERAVTVDENAVQVRFQRKVRQMAPGHGENRIMAPIASPGNDWLVSKSTSQNSRLAAIAMA